jgi:hypothetical protein
MAVDFWADKYWNGQYFNVKYFGTGEVDLNAMSGSASGSATAAGTLTFVNAALETSIRSFVWGIRRGRYEDPDKPIKVKAATQRQKRKAVAQTVEDILGIRAPSILAITEKEAIAEAAQMLLESERLQANIDELEMMVASKLEEISIEERRRRRNRQAAQILFLAA